MLIFLIIPKPLLYIMKEKHIYFWTRSSYASHLSLKYMKYSYHPSSAHAQFCSDVQISKTNDICVCVCVCVQVEGEIREYNWVIGMLTVKSWREVLNVFEAVPTFEHNFLCLIEDLRPLLYCLWIFPLRLRALTLVMFTAREFWRCVRKHLQESNLSLFSLSQLFTLSLLSSLNAVDTGIPPRLSTRPSSLAAD